MHAIYVTGTAGAGKSTLTHSLIDWYRAKGSHAIGVNLDPGAITLPYDPDVDVREFVDVYSLMEEKQLGPNGALILASDLIATQLPRLQEEVDSLNPDYIIVDTPGQVELFAYRQAGPFVVQNLRCEEKVVLFLFDAPLVGNASNFVSTTLLAASIQLRLLAPQIPILSKADLVGEKTRTILTWSSKPAALEEAVAREVKSGDAYLFTQGILRNLVRLGLRYEIIPISSMNLEGFVELSALITRILRRGEEVED